MWESDLVVVVRDAPHNFSLLYLSKFFFDYGKYSIRTLTGLRSFFLKLSGLIELFGNLFQRRIRSLQNGTEMSVGTF